MANDFSEPSTSVNHRRMNLMPRSSTVRSTYSASFVIVVMVVTRGASTWWDWSVRWPKIIGVSWKQRA